MSNQVYFLLLSFFSQTKPVNVSISDPDRGVIGLCLENQSINTLIYH